MANAQRYVRPTVGGWLRPTLIAPWISAYSAVTAFALLGIDKGTFGKVLGLAVGLVLASVWSFVFCTMLVLVDLSLLAVKVRTLPAGKRGWGAAFLAPLGVFGFYAVVPPYGFYAGGPWAVAAAVLIPMFVVAMLVRVFAGQKPLR